jgi:undecaprenyl-diphosphatase
VSATIYRDEETNFQERRTRAFICLFSSLVVVATWIAAVFFANYFDRPVIAALNSLAQKSLFFDSLAAAIATYNLFSGAAFLSMLWYCWFLVPDSRTRLNILCGTAGASVAAIVSRGLQFTLPTHPRPFYDPLMHFLSPFTVEIPPQHRLCSFTSDHAALFFGLAATIFSVHRRLGAAALALAVVLDVARLYTGFHYPSDLIGGGALGILFVCIFQVWHLGSFGRRILDFERRSAPAFYMLAFFISYGIATLFNDVRDLASRVHHLVR